MAGGKNPAEEQEPFHSLWTLRFPSDHLWSSAACVAPRGPFVVAVGLIVSSLFGQNLVSVSGSGSHKKRGNPLQRRSLQPDLTVLKCICSPEVQQKVH